MISEHHTEIAVLHACASCSIEEDLLLVVNQVRVQGLARVDRLDQLEWA
ncbi:MAG: hypothetical protein GY696_08455 [Gammaproteobacteria bacterium]|nr:hypothetical protein [Gammaproteobacteria bacterium]